MTANLSPRQERAVRNAINLSGHWVPQARNASTTHALYRRGLARSAFVRGVPLPVLTEAGEAQRARLIDK